jgi:hypothetical protein
MPWNNVPEEKWPEMEKCVMDVMASGKDKESATAICVSSITESKPMAECILAFDTGLLKSTPLAEAATIKSRVRAMIKAIDDVLTDREVPEALRASVKGMREIFKTKAWADLATDAASISQPSENEQPKADANNLTHFAESYGGVAIMEDASINANPARAPLIMQVQLIRPGWGNAKQNHYYPAEMLRRDAHVFEGVKMHTSDHKAGEKSERTEVSVIEKIIGFTDDGAPIARVSVFDPAFAEKVRSRQKSGHLDKLECSILGNGTAVPYERDGRKGRIVESIIDAESVDWVTRAGAGGKALNIAEGEPTITNEGVNMTDQGQIVAETTSPVTPAAPVVEVATPAPAAVPTRLSELEVTALLEAEKRLPVVSRVRLAEGQYVTADAVKAATVKELAYLKELYGSGQPFALGAAPSAPAKSITEKLAEANQALDAVNKKYLHGGSK